MSRLIVSLAVALGVTACSDSADVDSSTTLPGTWQCDDEITLILGSDGRYEWHVLHDDDYSLHTTDSDQMKMTEQGHVLLGQWRVSDDQLEFDMLGETDRFSLEFTSASQMRINGPENYTCDRV